MFSLPLISSLYLYLIQGPKKAIVTLRKRSLWPFYRGIRPFKKGAFRFAVNNNVSILPIVITFRGKKEKQLSIMARQ